ncbi:MULTISPECIES: oxygenase MpaB family protein [Acinetobacter]|uniref:Oxygenase MpaB family protein n=1 Tax=Acinetobacter nematophilus TaxID=2994642 RepID=A0A9X3DVQ8_9GAMM|nr:oxygenase MpaB family protein [Acinetobacter nematophilus]MCX5468086.1 oxygenase MpaB family protein [Acinetobacter nematophilus]
MTEANIHFNLDINENSLTDTGLFGPNSITWKVWSHPAAFVGLTRSFYIEVLGSMDAAAALSDRATYKSDPVGRLSRTMSYFLTVIFGDRETVRKANIRLFKLHSHIKGNVPLTGKSYSAHDPLLVVGTHLITWHSVYYAYEKLVGKLPKEEEEQYFKESVRYLESLKVVYPDLSIETVKESALRHGYDLSSLNNLTKLPDTRDEFRRYIKLTNSKAVITSQTRDIINTLLDPSSVESNDQMMNLILKFYPILKKVVISLTPKEICHLAGLHRSPTTDFFGVTLGKLFVQIVSINSIKSIFESRIGSNGYALMHEALLSE